MATRSPQHHDDTHHGLFRMLPSVNDVLLMPSCQAFLTAQSRSVLLVAVRRALDELRLDISSGKQTEDALQQSIFLLPARIARHLASGKRYSLRTVINATGVILHTNLGRAPLSDAALRPLVA